MALTITVDEYNGAGEVKTAGISAVAFGSADTPDLTPVDNQIKAGTNSFSKYIKFTFADFVGEGITEVNTTKVYKSVGEYKTGESVVGEGLGPVSFATPTATDTADSAIDTTLPAAQNLALAGSDTGVLAADGSSDYWRLQRQTTVGTPNGALNDLTFSLIYDTVP